MLVKGVSDIFVVCVRLNVAAVLVPALLVGLNRTIIALASVMLTRGCNNVVQGAGWLSSARSHLPSDYIMAVDCTPVFPIEFR